MHPNHQTVKRERNVLDAFSNPQSLARINEGAVHLPHPPQQTMKVDPSVAAVFDSLFDDTLEEEFQRVLGSHNFDTDDFVVRPLLPNLPKKSVTFAESKPKLLPREPSYEDLLQQLHNQESALKKIAPDIQVKGVVKKQVKAAGIGQAASKLESDAKPKRENPLICNASREALERSVQSTQEKHRLLKRKSEDWNFKPKSVHRKRLKWEKEELTLLWQGIAQHGNNWTAIKNMVGTRSYCQIKDKGRRALFLLGWQTGRSKTETDSSGVLAKRIAEEVLTGL